MSMNIADIGIKADTNDLAKARAELKSLSPAAQAAAAAVGKLGLAAEAAAAATAQAAFNAAKATESKARSDMAAAAAAGRMSKADREAAKATIQSAAAATAAAKAELDRVRANNAAAASARKNAVETMAQAAALEKAAAKAAAARNAFRENAMSMTGRSPGGGSVPANDQMPNRFNTANIAAQFQDIGVTAAMGMNPLTIAIQQGTQLSAILNTMESPLKGIAVAFKSILNPISLLSIAFVGLVAALIQFVDWVKVGQGIVNMFAGVLDWFADHIVGVTLVLGALGTALLTLYGGAMMAVISGWIVMGATATVAGIKMAAAWVVAMGPVGWVLAGIASIVAAIAVFNEEISKILGYDIVEGAKKGVNQIIGFFVGAFNGIIALFKNLPSILGGLIGVSGANAADIFKKEFNKSMKKDYVGAAGKVLSDAADGVRKYASGIGVEKDKKTRGKSEGERYEDIIKGAEREIAALEAEKAALGMTTEAAERLKKETELLNQAQQKNITLSPEQKRALGELAGTMAALEEETRKTKEAIDFAKDATKGFFSDVRSGLQEGKSLWESFGNAVTNVLNKIIDKLADVLIDDAFSMLTSSTGSGGNGMGFLGDIFGFLFNAKGNAFGRGGVQEFAKGSAFTNKVVSSPTLFQFANGGGFSSGVMGEAGPEAVMPLQRGPDGSLGVRVNGGHAGGSPVSVVVNNYSNANARVEQRNTSNGVEIDVVVEEIVAKKYGDRGSEISKAVNARNSQKMISR